MFLEMASDVVEVAADELISIGAAQTDQIKLLSESFDRLMSMDSHLVLP